jgi:hypothetical protein
MIYFIPMKKIAKFLIFVFMFMVLVVPVLSFAQSQGATVPVDAGEGLVPCGDEVVKDSKGAAISVKNPCGFDHFLILVNRAITFALFGLVLPICAIMFAYSGFLMVTSGGETSARTKAKKIFTNVAIGLIIAIASWLIVKLVLDLLGYDGSWIGF